MNDLFYPKFFSLVRGGIPREQLSSDILTGVVVGIVALPLSPLGDSISCPFSGITGMKPIPMLWP